MLKSGPEIMNKPGIPLGEVVHFLQKFLGLNPYDFYLIVNLLRYFNNLIYKIKMCIHKRTRKNKKYEINSNKHKKNIIFKLINVIFE